MARILISESCGAFSSVKLYQENPKTGQLEIRQQGDTKAVPEQQVHSGQASVKLYSQKCLVTFRQVFLPYGYPDSVSSDYLQYQIWDTVQAFSSSITGALATEAVMKGVGVGDETASTLAATMTWLIKSGSGMIGQILFAWAKGTALDHDNKKWRLFADVLNDLATFIDLITPLFPSSIITLVFCCSSVARALVGVAGGGTRAAITQHQARKNNSADVSAKDGSQETFVNLMSLLVCLLLLPAVSGKVLLVWSLFGIFTFLHVYSNYRAIRALQLETFNTSRLLLCLAQYLKNGRVPTVKQVNANESVVIGFGIEDTDVCHFRIRLGVSIEDALMDTNDDPKQILPKRKLQKVLDNSGGRSFLIIPKLESTEFNIVLHENVSPSDMIEAFVRAVFTAATAAAHYTSDEPPHQLQQLEELNGLSDAVTEDWEMFRHCVTAAGFSTSIALLKAGDWRAKWKHL